MSNIYIIKFNMDNIFTNRQTIPSFVPINSMALHTVLLQLACLTQAFNSLLFVLE